MIGLPQNRKLDGPASPWAGPQPEPGICTSCRQPVPAVRLVADWIVPELCDSCAKAAEDARVKMQARQHYQELVERSNLPHETAAWTFRTADQEAVANLSTDELNTWRAAANTCKVFNPEYKVGLYLHGPAGGGKSVLAACALKAAMWKTGLSGLWLNVPVLFAEMRRGFSDRSMAQDWLGRARRAMVLVLDDIGAENPQPWIREALFVVVDDRLGKGRPTIYTSNCTPGDLHDHLGDPHGRIVDRIVGSCRLVELDLPSWRLRTGDQLRLSGL